MSVKYELEIRFLQFFKKESIQKWLCYKHYGLTTSQWGYDLLKGLSNLLINVKYLVNFKDGLEFNSVR
jgi:hypothetical protein